MADPRLKRKFTARDAYNLMMQETNEAREDYKAAQIAETIFGLTAGAGYQGSAAQSKNKSYVNSFGKGLSSGSSSRYKMLQDADKEDLAQMFTDEFNTALPTFTSIMDFNQWATKMGDWYQEDLRGKHSTIVRNALTGRSKKATEDATMTFVDEHGTDWLTNDFAEQQKIIAELFAATEGDPQGAIKRKAIMDSLTGALAAQGQFTVRDQALQEEAATTALAQEARASEKWTTEKVKVSTQKSKDMIADDIASDAAACVLAGDGSPKAREDCFQQAKNKQNETYPNIVKQVQEDARKIFDAAVAKTPTLQTETYYDSELKEYVLATEQEARDQGLKPAKAGEIAKPTAPDKYYIEVGMEMADDPTSGLTPEMFDYYRQDMERINSVITQRPQDAKIIIKWMLEVVKRRKKAATFGIDFTMMQSGDGTPASSGIISITPTEQ